ncbi:MAG: glycogen/starch/alpha-glucan phosphorylase [Clostridiales bacterium]|nr:glycogen/starch/alpha-glucan phosphorylase [Clostridiales bacterium]
MKYKLTVAQAKELIESKISHYYGVTPEDATNEHFYKSIVLIVSDLMKEAYKEFHDKAKKQNKKTVYYLCMEFLMGRSLKNNLYNLGLENTMASALSKFGVKLENIYEEEPDAGLGNGGLGRLAACFLDGLATQCYPSMGYSLRYEYGIFSQKFVDGWQTELPDFWLPGGAVWLQPAPEKSFDINFNGHLEESWDNNIHKVNLVEPTTVTAVPYDMYVSGMNGKGISRLRLWAAQGKHFDMKLFNDGQYMRAIEQNAMAESITKVLYPGDNHAEGKSLRLNQQYFLVSATIQDIIRRHLRDYGTLDNFSDLVTIHMNDTHPVLAVPELMRIMMDECGYSWNDAWNIVSKTIAYTNHTVMREALECWGEDMFKAKLPRIYQIVCEINRRFCSDLNDKEVDQHTIDNVSIINDGAVRMANLAVMASYKVNGVSQLHSDILKKTVFKDFYNLMPDKFTNVTNGIAHRRWLNQSNPRLASLLCDTIGNGYICDAYQLKKLEAFADDTAVLDELAAIKLLNKIDMAKYIKAHNGIVVDPDSIFDVQVKRLHEYKRQLMNAVQILSVYLALKENKNMDFVPKTFIFGAKAAPGYYFAKEIIRFIFTLADIINNDPDVNDKIKVVYLEDYRVTVAEKLIPASELSEQISLAGTEASGTSNMKFMINGALTLGTLDGANVEIHQCVGEDNMFLFGLTTPEVNNIKNSGYYPQMYYNNNPVIKKAIDYIRMIGFDNIADNLVSVDPYMVLADFSDYSLARQRASAVYLDKNKWNKMSLINIANAGIFAADRAIRDYANDIWNMKPVQ